jgi:hypothetical protein
LWAKDFVRSWGTANIYPYHGSSRNGTRVRVQLGVEADPRFLSRAVALTAIERFYFVVTGAGAAGLVVANRPSKRCRHRVPDGSDRTFRTRAPMGYGRSITDHKVNWMYEAQPARGTNGVPIIFGAIPHGGVSR